MLGAIIGDIVGSVFEWAPNRSKEFDLISEKSRFTDDSMMTVAAADALLHGGDYTHSYKHWARTWPDAGYGRNFKKWFMSDGDEKGNSFGNGSAMRVSPVGWARNTIEDVLAEAQKSAEPSHNHPEGIKGACAIASSVFLARTGASKDEIKSYVTDKFGYDLTRTLDEIRPEYKFDVTCQGSVPQAITAFLESESFEDAIAGAVSLGGDSDTQAAMAGAIAEAFYGGVPKRWIAMLNILMPQEAMHIASEFNKEYQGSRYNFFCCARESADGRPAEKGLPLEIAELSPDDCRWWVREPDAENEVWAFVTPSELPHEAAVYFCTEEPMIFDTLIFKSFEDAFIALDRNGFDLLRETYGVEAGLAAHPRGIFRPESHPIFSSGELWI